MINITWFSADSSRRGWDTRTPRRLAHVSSNWVRLTHPENNTKNTLKKATFTINTYSTYHNNL